MEQLPLFLNLSGQPVLVVGDGDAAAAKARLVERAGGTVIGDPAGAARIAFVALADDDAAAAMAAGLRARGLLVNVVDRPALCDFTTPAVLDRQPLLLAIGTGGASAGLAKALRQRLEVLVPGNLGELARALAGARPRLRARWPDAAARRRAIDGALAPGGPLDPLGTAQADWPTAVAAWLAADEGAPPPAGLVAIILASADPDDLTLRQARWLASADQIVHHPAVPGAILARARADAGVTVAAAMPPAPLDGGLTVWVGPSPAVHD